MRGASARSAGAESKTKAAPHSTRRERQIVRVLALLRTLGQGRKPTVHELAAEFRTRRETIYRDLRVLQDAGYPITGDEGGRLSRPRMLPSQLPDIRFSGTELDALLSTVAQAQIALPNEDSLSSAVSKLKALAESAQTAPQPNLDEIFNTWTCGEKDYRAHEDHIAVLVEALLRKRQCTVEYLKPSASQSKTYPFQPYRLLFVGHGLYIIGRVPKHGGVTTLAVERLRSVVLSTLEFQVDPDFDPQRCREDAFGVSWQDPIEVVLRFRAEQAPYIRERQWHPSQKLIDKPDGSVQLEFRAGGLFEIRRWILGWADAVEVFAPEGLRQSVQEALHAAASRYQP